MTDRTRRHIEVLGALAAVLLATTLVPTASAQSSEPDAGARHGSAAHSAGSQVAIPVVAGQWITVGTCGVVGARHEGDTTIALVDPDGSQVAYSDDACGGLGSRLVHRATRTGTYHAVLACYASRSCGGRTVWRTGDAEAEAAALEWSAGWQARALVGPDGQGLVADAWLAARIDVLGGMVLRLSGAPLGIAGGPDGGILGGSVQLTVSWDLDFIELGMGGGVSTLSWRGQGVTQREVGVIALRARAGTELGIHVTGQVLLGLLPDEEIDVTADVTGSIPVDDVEILARGIYGMSGVWLGELGLLWWPGGSGRSGVGLALLAGGSAVSYQPVCRFGAVCQASTYAGPHVGLGIHVRP